MCYNDKAPAERPTHRDRCTDSVTQPSTKFMTILVHMQQKESLGSWKGAGFHFFIRLLSVRLNTLGRTFGLAMETCERTSDRNQGTEEACQTSCSHNRRRTRIPFSSLSGRFSSISILRRGKSL